MLKTCKFAENGKTEEAQSDAPAARLFEGRIRGDPVSHRVRRSRNRELVISTPQRERSR
jgi:hypothetical protein